MAGKQPKPERLEDIEITPTEWADFKRAVVVSAKSPPQHRTAKPVASDRPVRKKRGGAKS
jgi:hypothetical protein